MELNGQLRELFNDASHNPSPDLSFDGNWQVPVVDIAESAQQSDHAPIIRPRQQQLALKFYEIALVQNQPCIFSEKTTRHWQSRREWVTPLGKPNFDYLVEHFGGAVVPVADCQIKHYNSQLKENMAFDKYLQYWKALLADNYNHQKHRNLYLKDWHFTRDFPFYDAYQTHECFSSDWLNEFWNKRTSVCDDYRFVYMGPKGTWTPLHADVFHSYSWSANICGLKKWILLPPEEEENLQDCNGKLAYDIESPVDPRQFQNYHKIRHRFEVLQKPGEIIFIPSRWLHQVINLEDTISINHNWFNGFNIGTIWQSLCNALKEVEAEIDDCKSMEGWQQQCQLLLKATHGMDFEEFNCLLCMIGQSRLDLLKKIHSQAPAKVDEWEMAHIIFDLERILHIFKNMLNKSEEWETCRVSLKLYQIISDHLEDTGLK